MLPAILDQDLTLDVSLHYEKKYQFECVIDLPWVNPVRDASSEKEFIKNILAEYNGALCGLVEIVPSDIRNIKNMGEIN